MTPKYNRALDLIACAAASYTAGNLKEASSFVTQAFKSPDCEEATLAMLHHNEAAVKAAADDAPDSELPGEELRLEPDENKPREVQQGAARARAAAARRSSEAATASSVSAARQRSQNYFASLRTK
jgi:hypothetical protein